MASNRFTVTDLDFNTIKQNLKEYLRSQSTFSDYNFEGSGLNVLLDILAYNTHYKAFYLNMVANESFLDSAISRDSVVSHAKSLGYTPNSISSAKSIINFTVKAENSDPDLLFLPRGFSFKSNLVDNTSYNFCLLEEVVANKVGQYYYFRELEICEGQLINYVYTFNADTNPKGIFKIPSKNVEISSIQVKVQNSVSDLETTVFTLVNDVLDVDENSEIFFLQEGLNEFYEIYFGNGIIGKAIADGSIISISYLITSGEDANHCSAFSMSTSAFEYLSYTIEVLAKSSGGSSKETLDSIKFNSIAQFVTQNRLVTSIDYANYLLKKCPEIESISVWGGEDEIPAVYGKVFISIKPKEDYYFPTEEKDRIINEILTPKKVLTTGIKIVDPDYLYLKLQNSVRYDKRKITSSETQLKSEIRSAVYSYVRENLNKFDSTFIISKLQEYIDSINTNAIIGCETKVRLEKRIVPYLNELRNYTVNFNLPLYKGTTLNRLISSEFTIFDKQGVARNVFLEEVPDSYTGISDIRIINAGYNYKTAPTVTITGDGYGASAVAKIINGKISTVEIVNQGINYTKATITFSGGDGFGAEAVALLNTNKGTLRTVYFNQFSERVVIEPNAGTIDYIKGTLVITNLNIQQMNTFDNLLRLSIQSSEGIFSSVRNTIITLDETDSTAVIVELSSE